MNSLIHLKMASLSLLVMFGLGFSFAPSAQAVVPPPDGGYPGGNTAEGQNALFSLTTGGFNTAVGWLSLRSNTDGNFNTAVGAATLVASAGSWNTATGVGALFNDMSIGGNTALGAVALFSNTTGGDNTAIGFNALDQNTTGSDNIALGFGAGSEVTTASNVIAIGLPAANVSNSCFIGSIFGATASGGAAVFINSSGQLGTVASAQQFKKDIATMGKASETILSLRPVTFHYRSDTKETPQFGLIAEEVAKVNPALVLPDKEGKPYSVRYEQVNAMLLNEFLKEHKTVQELKKEIAALKAAVNNQDSKIQRINGQLALNNPAPQVADNNQ
jgi:Chaperone of endosialidase